MKAALLAMLLAAPAGASELGADWQGGQMRLLNQPCKNTPALQAAYFKPQVGQWVWACWLFGGDTALVHMEGADSLIRIDWSQFRVVTDGSEYRPRRPEHPKADGEI